MTPTDEQLAELYPWTLHTRWLRGGFQGHGAHPMHHRARVSSAGSCGATVTSESTDDFKEHLGIGADAGD